MTEHAELGDVALEEECDRPIGDHAQLSREQRELVEVVRPRDEPTEEAAELEAQHLGDALAPAQGRDLAEHPVAVGLRVAAQVLRQPTGLAERVLRGGRIGPVRRRLVRDAGAVAER